MKKYEELYMVAIVDRDLPLEVTRLIDSPIMQMPGLAITARVRTEKYKAAFSKIQNNLGNTIFTLSMLQKEIEN